MREDGSIGVGVLGLGVIGSQVARVLLDQTERLAHQVGAPVVLRRAVDIDTAKLQASGLPGHLLTTDAADVVNSPEVDVVVELIGGVHPAMDLLTTALSQGKHAVTANKELMAKQGPELIELAEQNGVHLLYEASVGGGIPIIGPLKKDLLANEITSIYAIINGTTNYIVTKMSREGLDFDSALRQAQAAGFAESDPTNDIEGFDPAYKLAILASLAFHTRVRAEDVYREGISRLAPQDFQYADELGYAIKLLAIARCDDDVLSLRVHPALVPYEHLLARVDGVFNAIEIEGDLVGQVLFHGQGAGPLPTSSAVVGDTVEIARGIVSRSGSVRPGNFSREVSISPMEELTTSYYARLTVADHAGVLANITKVLGDLSISIASIIQKNADPTVQTAEIVITTHPAQERAVQEAFHQMEQIDVVKEVGSLIRVENWS
ncbi:MAG: homoserine dehydrogenase [Chloroflexi bacterium]|nr:homoserine dehydrogenase [Chloroflexota bacterium]